MTAVEYLEEIIYGDKEFSLSEVFEKAKKMEKQQIIDAFEAEKRSIISHNYNDRSVTVSYISSEQYYKETFKKNE